MCMKTYFWWWPAQKQSWVSTRVFGPSMENTLKSTLIFFWVLTLDSMRHVRVVWIIAADTHAQVFKWLTMAIHLDDINARKAFHAFSLKKKNPACVSCVVTIVTATLQVVLGQEGLCLCFKPTGCIPKNRKLLTIFFCIISAKYAHLCRWRSWTATQVCAHLRRVTG